MGTMPSDISLTKREYYANPTNDFWRLVGAVLNRRGQDSGTGIPDLRPAVIQQRESEELCQTPATLEVDAEHAIVRTIGWYCSRQ